MQSPRRATATRAAFKDSHRVASFTAHVLSGIFLVGILGTHVFKVISNSIYQAPSVHEWVMTRLKILVPWTSFTILPCWTSSVVPIAMSECWHALRNHQDLHDPDVLYLLTSWFGLLSIIAFTIIKFNSIGSYCWLQLVVLIQWCVALYQIGRIAISMMGLLFVKFIKHISLFVKRCYINVFGIRKKHADNLRQLMKETHSYMEWAAMAKHLDTLEGKVHFKSTITYEDEEHCDFKQLKQIIETLNIAIGAKNVDALKFLVPSLIHRNKIGIDAPHLHFECNTGTKDVIENYQQLVVQALDILATADSEQFPDDEKLLFFRKLKQSFGSTALCLSGGGSIAMYHTGVIKALIENGVMPNVISGSSGGSIIAALLACNTNEEMLRRIIKNDIAIRYVPFGVRWFPPLLEQLEHCIKTGFLVECADFERTTQHYYSEPLDAEDKIMYYTFEDAYLKTGRHICITVSASDFTGHKGPKKLLLNHVNTPHVLLWSAVAVSCSLPGIMKGKNLMARDHEGNVVPYDALNKQWMDGSIQHDLPMETMASCFNVTNFIVSQVNPHVVPFMGDDIHNPNVRKSVFHVLESVIAADVRHRLKMLAFLGLFPRIYGHQFSSYFRQNFSGNVTLIPDFIFLEKIGIKAILSPTHEDMDRYIAGGQRVVWPKLAYIGHLCKVEKSLDRILYRFLGPRVIRYENWLNPTIVT